MGNKIRIYDMSFSLYQLVDRYKEKKVLFSNQIISQQNKQTIAREALNALLYGIPYPQVYASELQNGQLLVLENDNRLRCLIEFITGKIPLDISGLSIGGESYFDLYHFSEKALFSDIPARDRQDILRSKVSMCVIEYETPVYVHMRIGAYVGNWSIEQEEAMRQVLYRDKGSAILQGMLNTNARTRLALIREAEIVVFLTYIANFVWKHSVNYKMDQYYMQEIMFQCVDSHKNDIEELVHVYQESRKHLADTAFCYQHGTRSVPVSRKFKKKYSNIKPMEGHILGMSACMCHDIYDVKELCRCADEIMYEACEKEHYTYGGDIESILKSSDLSNISIMKIFNRLGGRI